jgi:hypothetical protein
MISRRAVIFGCAVAVAACNTAPGLHDLQGKWGGHEITVRVGASNVDFGFRCSQAISSKPIVPDGNGRFSVVATLYTFRPDTSITINGVVAGGWMQLDFPVVPSDENPGKLHYDARLGVPSNLDGVAAFACP